MTNYMVYKKTTEK